MSEPRDAQQRLIPLPNTNSGPGLVALPTEPPPGSTTLRPLGGAAQELVQLPPRAGGVALVSQDAADERRSSMEDEEAPQFTFPSTLERHRPPAEVHTLTVARTHGEVEPLSPLYYRPPRSWSGKPHPGAFYPAPRGSHPLLAFQAQIPVDWWYWVAPTTFKLKRGTTSSGEVTNHAYTRRGPRNLIVGGQGEAFWGVTVKLPNLSSIPEFEQPPLVHARVDLHVSSSEVRPEHGVFALMRKDKWWTKYWYPGGVATYPRIRPFGPNSTTIHLGAFQPELDAYRSDALHVGLFLGHSWQVWSGDDEMTANRLSVGQGRYLKYHNSNLPLPKVTFSGITLEIWHATPDRKCRWALGGLPNSTGPAAWMCSGTERVAAGDRAPASVKQGADLSLAANEVEFVQVVVTVPKGDLNPYTWKVVWKPAPSTLPPPKLTIHKMEYLKVKGAGNLTYGYGINRQIGKAEEQWVADVLYPLAPTTSGAQYGSEPFKLATNVSTGPRGRLNVPFLFEMELDDSSEYASGGCSFVGEVTLLKNGAATGVTFNLSIRARRFALSSRPTLPVTCALDGTAMGVWRKWWNDQFPNNNRELKVAELYRACAASRLVPVLNDAWTFTWVRPEFVPAGSPPGPLQPDDVLKHQGIGIWRRPRYDLPEDAPGSKDIGTNEDLLTLLAGMHAARLSDHFVVPNAHLSFELHSRFVRAYSGQVQFSPPTYPHLTKPHHPKTATAFELKWPYAPEHGKMLQHHLTTVKHILELFHSFAPSPLPNGPHIWLSTTDELGTHPSPQLLDTYRAVGNIVQNTAALRRMRLVGYQLRHTPALDAYLWWFFWSSYAQFEPDELYLFQRQAGRHKCLYEYTCKASRLLPIRLRLLPWRLWKERFEALHVGNVMYWRTEKEFQFDKHVKRKGKTTTIQVTVDQHVFQDPRDVVSGDPTGALLMPLDSPGRSGTFFETLRWKLLRRALDDHAYLTLLQRAIDAMPAGTSLALKSRAALERVDSLIWRVPANAYDHPYTRDAREVEALHERIGDLLDDVQQRLIQEPETKWKPGIEPIVPATGQAVAADTVRARLARLGIQVPDGKPDESAKR